MLRCFRCLNGAAGHGVEASGVEVVTNMAKRERLAKTHKQEVQRN